MKELYITKNHTGKMEGMQSLSTSCKCNEQCIERRKIKGSICEHCYSWRQISYMPALEIKLAENYHKLQAPIEPEKIPRINALYFRFDADTEENKQHIFDIRKDIRNENHEN